MKSDAQAFAMALQGKTPEAIRAQVEEGLVTRLKHVSKVYRYRHAKNSRIIRNRIGPTKRALEVQAEFLAGAIAGIHAVLGDGDKLPEEISGATFGWFVKTLRGELVVDPWP